MTNRDATADALETLLREVRACRHCESQLPLGPRPELRARVASLM